MFYIVICFIPFCAVNVVTSVGTERAVCSAIKYLLLFEPRCEKTGLRGVPTRSDTNRAVQQQKLVRGLKFRIYVVEGLYYPIAKTKAMISSAFTAQLNCVFVFAHAKSRFSHNEARLVFVRSGRLFF